MAYPILTLTDNLGNSITEINFGTINAGAYSDEIELRVYNLGTVTAYNVSAKLLNENNEEAGDPIIQKWIEYKIDTEWIPMGINSYPRLGTIHPNDYKTIFLRLRAPVGVSTGNVTIKIALSDGVYPVILTDLSNIVDNGIFRGDNGVLRCGIEANASEVFTLERTVLRIDDKLAVIPETEILLNQNDVNEAALIGGEKYYAVAGYDDGLIIQKGEKGEEPVIPEVSGIKLFTVSVVYNEGGSQINNDDIIWDYGLIEAGIRLSDNILEMGSFKALLDNKIFELGNSFILLNSGDNWIHLTESGAIGNSSIEDENALNLYKIEYSETPKIYDLRHFIDSCIKEKVFNIGEVIPKGSACDVSTISYITLSSDINRFIGIAEQDIFDSGYIIKSGKCEALVSGGEFGDSLTPLEGKLVTGEDKVGILLEQVLQEGLAYIEL